MCNVSVSDDIITIPQPALLVPAGPGDQCWCVFSVCVGWAVCCHSIFFLPPFQPGSCQNVDPSSSTHCNCHPATASHRYSASVTLILSLILVLVASYG
ncbi:unnamed protein product, partial [Staurois parvus]